MSTCACCGNAGHEEDSGQSTVWSLGMVNDESQEFLGRPSCRTAQGYRFAALTRIRDTIEETVRYVLKDANEKVFLGYSNTRLKNPASTNKLLDTIAGCEGDTVPMEKKYSYGSGRRSRRELLGRLFCIKSLVIRRAEAEAEKDMTIRCGMVDDCYVEKFDVACWHRKGV